MKIKTKKSNRDGIVRLETEGQIKEILIQEDLLKPKETKVNVCFRGKSSSGIVEITPEEIETLYKEVNKRKSLFSNIKVVKFKE